MSETHHVPMPPIMSETVGRLIEVAAFALPAALFAAIGFQVGNAYTALAAIIVWGGVFFAQNYVEVEAMTFVVINCFGHHRTVKFGGWRLLLRKLHRITHIGDLHMHSIELFRGADGKLEPLDFHDGSAPVIAKAWWQAASPESIATHDWKAVREQIVRFVYRVSAIERHTLTKEVFQSVLRSVLEPNTMRGAQDKAMELARNATVIIERILKEVGVFPASTQSITFSGLSFTQEQRDLRMEGMRGEAEAARAINRAPAYFAPLVSMIKHCKEAGIDLDNDTSIRAFLTQKIIEALPELKGSISLVGADINKIISMIPLTNPSSTLPGSHP